MIDITGIDIGALIAGLGGLAKSLHWRNCEVYASWKLGNNGGDLSLGGVIS